MTYTVLNIVIMQWHKVINHKYKTQVEHNKNFIIVQDYPMSTLPLIEGLELLVKDILDHIPV